MEAFQLVQYLQFLCLHPTVRLSKAVYASPGVQLKIAVVQWNSSSPGRWRFRCVLLGHDAVYLVSGSLWGLLRWRFVSLVTIYRCFKPGNCDINTIFKSFREECFYLHNQHLKACHSNFDYVLITLLLLFSLTLSLWFLFLYSSYLYPGPYFPGSVEVSCPSVFPEHSFFQA